MKLAHYNSELIQVRVLRKWVGKIGDPGIICLSTWLTFENHRYRVNRYYTLVLFKRLIIFKIFFRSISETKVF